MMMQTEDLRNISTQPSPTNRSHISVVRIGTSFSAVYKSCVFNAF